MAEVKSKPTVGASTRRRTQHERRTSTRAALLTAAARTIVEHGPSTGLAEIARRAGVSTGALQYHFGSKTDLLIAVVEMGWNDLVERSRAAPRTGSPADRVAALVASVWAAYQQPHCRAAFMVSSDPNIDEDVAARIAPVFDDARSRLDRLWVDAFVDLELPIERIASARRFARSHLNGMFVQRQLASVEPDPEDELDLLCRATLRILTDHDTDTERVT